LEEAARKVTELKTALDKCRNQEPKIVKDTIDNSRKTLESVITFRQGRTTVDNSQLPNVERIATYLKNHKEASVVIKGYASPEGSVEVNDRIARQRAEIVKKMLVNRYGIAEERIVAEGQGVGNMFEEPDWNRVSICTINARVESRNR
jgi:outer membrane protein OmpA-like peptidoglycan-associated protein